MQPRNKKFYDELANTLSQKLKTCFPNIRFEKVGSRKRGDFKRDSDLDFQVFIKGTQLTKEQFYKKMKECINDKLPNFKGERINVKLGTNGNVLNVLPENGGKISYALMSD